METFKFSYVATSIGEQSYSGEIKVNATDENMAAGLARNKIHFEIGFRYSIELIRESSHMFQ